MSRFEDHFAELPLVAILRGIEPPQVEEVAEELLAAGFRLIEVPLNSRDAITSIALLSEIVGTRATIGAGTVLSEAQVDEVIRAGGQLIVSPNFDPLVVRRTIEAGAVSLPGFRTATEAFAAVAAGARILKFFPCSLDTAREIGALKAVLPTGVRILCVGGVNTDNVADYRLLRADGLGIGTTLYVPGKPLDRLASDAAELVHAWNGRW